ncbi:MAG TPA: methyltransferase domain-containing protein [Ktedonobacterales bacterium]|jgi:spermidine synthase|nr:methyltransferase domain-containing protein [Ktedonobacterales bacterium]
MTKKARRRAQRPLPVRAVARKDGRLALEVGSVTQSVTLPEDEADEVQGYWPLMLPERCPQRALLLGLGGGTLAALLARRCPGVAIVGIERNPEVLVAARREFGLDTLLGLDVVEADAFDWVEEHATSEPASFDLICLDLFEGGRLAPGTLARPFLRQVATLLQGDGVLTVNLMRTARLPEQIHRLESVFTIERQLRLWGNAVLHLSATAT